jgi:hypothetical protein
MKLNIISGLVIIASLTAFQSIAGTQNISDNTESHTYYELDLDGQSGLRGLTNSDINEYSKKLGVTFTEFVDFGKQIGLVCKRRKGIVQTCSTAQGRNKNTAMTQERYRKSSYVHRVRKIDRLD